MAGQPTFFTRVGGEVCGPFDVAGLRELVALGHLLPTDDLSRDGGTTWATAGRYKGLFPAAGAPVAVLPAPGATAEPTYRFTQAGQSAGPLPVSSLRELAANGALLPADLVWADGDPTSTAAAAHPALAGAFPAQALTYHAPEPTAEAAAVIDADPASFRLRFAAYVVDAVCIGTASGLLADAVGSAAGGHAPTHRLGQAVAYVGGWLYYALFESSALRATPGKWFAGLVVTDLNGRRLRFGRATGRYFGMYLSAATLGVGFLMALWTERRQALHDLLARTLVLAR